MELFREVLAWDEAVLLRMHRWRSPPATSAMRLLTRLGDASTWVILVLVLLAREGLIEIHAETRKQALA